MDGALTVGALASFILLIVTWVSLPQGMEEPRVANIPSTEAKPAHA